MVIQREEVFVTEILHLLLALLGPFDPQDLGHPASQDFDGGNPGDFGHFHGHPAGHLLPAGVDLLRLAEGEGEGLDFLEHHHGD